LQKGKSGYAFELLGAIYGGLGYYDTAIAYYDSAKDFYNEIGKSTERIMPNIGYIWIKMGEIEKAENYLLQDYWPLRLGKINLIKENYTEAAKYFSGGVDNLPKKLLNNLLSKTSGCIDENDIKFSLKKKYEIMCEQHRFRFCKYTGLGQAYEGLKEYMNARDNYKEAISMVEEQREVIASEHVPRFFSSEVIIFKRTHPYEGIVRVLTAMDNPDEAFLYSENLKARVLSETIVRRHSTLMYILPSSFEKEEDLYITKIRDLRNEIEALYRKNPFTIRQIEMDEKKLRLSEKRKMLNEVKANQRQFINRLRKNYPEYASIHYPQPIKPNEVKLNPNEVLVEFEVTDNSTLVFMLNNGKLKTRKVSISRNELRDIVLKYRGFFEGITKTGQLLQYEPDVGKKLYSLLLGDLLNDVAKGTGLIIVPDEFLGILPFEALVMNLPAEEKIGEGEYGPFPLGVKYLGDKYLISYAQSATSLTLLRTLKKDRVKGEGMFVVADPIFSANDSRLRTIAKADISEENLNLMGAIADWKQMGVAGVRTRDEGQNITSAVYEIFPRLEKTDELAQKMKSLFGSKAKILLGSDAREDKVVMSSLPEYRYLTFATHGILDNTVPYIKEPALVLTQFGNPESYDGFLTMTEVMGLKLDADVVALTACETGVGKNVSGEGVMGMGRAFQFAGARNVLVSLWSVAETSATELTIAFFKHLKEGNEPKQALRLARNEIRRKGYEHPFYWASFILFGE